MLRVSEAVIALAPFAGFAILYFLVLRGRGVPGWALLMAATGVLGLGVWLTWLGTSERLDRSDRYVPAVLRNGEVVQGHGE